MSLKSRDRVSYIDHKSHKITYGVVVVQAGDCVEVIPDNDLTTVVAGSPDFFQASEHPLPEYTRTEIDREWTAEMLTNGIFGSREIKFYKNDSLMFLMNSVVDSSLFDIEYARNATEVDFNAFLVLIHEWIETHTGKSVRKDGDQYVKGEIVELASTWMANFAWLGFAPAQYLTPKVDELSDFLVEVDEFKKQTDEKKISEEAKLEIRITAHDYDQIWHERFEKYSAPGLRDITVVDIETGVRGITRICDLAGFKQALAMISAMDKELARSTSELDQK